MRLTSGAYLVICSSCDDGLPAMFQVFPVLLASSQARLLACHSNGNFGKCIILMNHGANGLREARLEKMGARRPYLLAGSRIPQQDDAERRAGVEKGFEKRVAVPLRRVRGLNLDDRRCARHQ